MGLQAVLLTSWAVWDANWKSSKLETIQFDYGGVPKQDAHVNQSTVPHQHGYMVSEQELATDFDQMCNFSSPVHLVLHKQNKLMAALLWDIDW